MFTDEHSAEGGLYINFKHEVNIEKCLHLQKIPDPKMACLKLMQMVLN